MRGVHDVVPAHTNVPELAPLLRALSAASLTTTLCIGLEVPYYILESASHPSVGNPFLSGEGPEMQSYDVRQQRSCQPAVSEGGGGVRGLRAACGRPAVTSSPA